MLEVLQEPDDAGAHRVLLVVHRYDDVEDGGLMAAPQLTWVDWRDGVGWVRS